MFDKDHIEFWLKELKTGNRLALSKAITLVESQKPEDQLIAREILKQCRNSPKIALRIGITGPPGAGKSSLIELLGLKMINAGNKIAILSIDPSSAKTKGSILGDKTRMTELSTSEQAFIRPSPTSEFLGGVARHTQECITLCEAAGYDFIIIETAGIGQSEIVVSQMTDLTLLLTLPGAGDVLQGIKKGVMEWADILVLNKADDPKDPIVIKTYRDLIAAIQIQTKKFDFWTTKIIKTSCTTGEGIDELHSVIRDFFNQLKSSDLFIQLRDNQRIEYFDKLCEHAILTRIFAQPQVPEYYKEVKNRLKNKEILPEEASDLILEFIFAVLRK